MIPPEMERLLEPLERFEGIRRRAVRLGPRLCDLAYANPYDGVREEARAALAAALQDRRLLDLQYSPFGGRTLSRRAAADDLRERHGLDFSFDDVVLTPGAAPALQLALRAAGASGNDVVVPVPCWLDHPLFVLAADRAPRLVTLPAPSFELDPEAVLRAITPAACAVLLAHPANPTGRSYTAEELDSLAGALRAAERRHGFELTLIADESHRDFARHRYRSAAEFFDRTVIVYSFAKYHFMQGQRLGYAAVSPRHPARHQCAAEMVRWSRIIGYAMPNALMQLALPHLLRLRHDLTPLWRWRDRFQKTLVARGYDVVASDSTMFMYFRTPDGYDDFEYTEALASAGLLTLPAPVFHHDGYCRLSLTGSDDMLARALDTLERFAP